MEDIKFAFIDTQEDLEYLISQIKNGPTFAEPFKFKTEELVEQLFTYLKISIDDFTKKYYYYDDERKLHISESYEGYYWISTMGLVAPRDRVHYNKNTYVRACHAQFIVLDLLLEKAISVCKDDGVYDVDGYYFGYLNELTTALFHNVIFYFELFGKAYLSLNDVKFDRTHELKKILRLVKETMFKLNQNDTSFHAYTVAEFERISNYLGTIPNDFREEFVKYEDNPGDSTVIVFGQRELSDLSGTIAVSNDIITDYYFKKTEGKDLSEVLHLRPGLFNKLLNMSQTEEDRQRIIDTYSYLLKKD